MTERTETVASARSYGWMRRPEFDTPGKHVWEDPEGGLWTYGANVEPQIRKLRYTGLGPYPTEWCR